VRLGDCNPFDSITLGLHSGTLVSTFFEDKSPNARYTIVWAIKVAARTSPQYFPDNLELPLPTNHKTWHTERLCPPLLAYALGTDQALFIAQLHYWLQKDNVGVYKHGFHWIYNAEWEWREQFPWLSEHTIGRIRRALERQGYVVSNDFNRNPLDRTKHSTLDYYRIAQQTGWNPLGLDLNREYPHPPVFTKGVRQRGRHKSDSTPLVYLPVDGDEPDSLKSLETVDSALLQNASCKPVTMHSAPLPLSSIHKEIPNTSKSNLETDLKIELREGNQGIEGFQLLGNENTSRQADGQEEAEKEASEQVTKSSGQGQSDAADPFLINDGEIELAQQFLTSLNASVERANSERTPAKDLTRPIRIPGLDESAHEILWKHQAQLEKLNADLNAERIQKAIADNPQYLESAILAFIENSAQGAKTPEAATGFLLNALRQGWKPRQSLSSTGAFVPVYTPPPQMLEEPKPSTLEELVQRKHHLWQVAPLMRPSIKVWAEETPGVIVGWDGPSLVVESASNNCLSESAATPTNEPAAPHLNPVPTTPEALTTPAADSTELVTTPAADPTACAPTLRAPEASEPAPAPAPDASTSPTIPADPATDPHACTSTREADPPLKVGDRVIWMKAPAHWSNWGALSIRAIEGSVALVDWSEMKIPLLELRRVHLPVANCKQQSLKLQTKHF